jgi:cytochrome c oxidase cbb3-type subunit 3/ubiquinol-cytochrome c reductase cytochrome c subunit
MKIPPRAATFFALSATALLCMGCSRMPGYPKPGPEVVRPDQVLEFPALYKQNCAGCHGANGRDGAALPLNNPAYLAVAGADNLRTLTAKGASGTLMPPFAQSAGGMLTDKQIDALVQGMLREWSRPAEFAGVSLPPYAGSAPGDPAEGQKVFVAACARCHGADGLGVKPTVGKPTPSGSSPDSIVDPAYLALVSDQSLRSLILAGRPDEDVPDWRSVLSGPGAHALTPREIDNLVAWLASHRASSPGQPKRATPGNLPAAAGKENR